MESIQNVSLEDFLLEKVEIERKVGELINPFLKKYPVKNMEVNTVIESIKTFAGEVITTSYVELNVVL